MDDSARDPISKVRYLSPRGVRFADGVDRRDVVGTVGCDASVEEAQRVPRVRLRLNGRDQAGIDVNGWNHTVTEYGPFFFGVSSQHMQIGSKLLPHLGGGRAGWQFLKPAIDKRPIIRQPVRLPRLSAHLSQ